MAGCDFVSQGMWAHAREFLQSGALREAKDAALSGLRRAPADPELLAVLGETLLQVEAAFGDPGDAIFAVLEELDRGPSYQQALPLLERALTLRPAVGGLHFMMANALAETGDRVRAEEYYAYCCALEPSEPSHWEQRTANFLALDKKEHRIDCIVQLADIDPLNPKGHDRCLKELRAFGDWPRLEARANHALNLFPDHAQSLIHLGLCARRRDKEEAIAFFRRAVVTDHSGEARRYLLELSPPRAPRTTADRKTDHLADFLFLSVGRVATLSTEAFLKAHPDIDVIYSRHASLTAIYNIKRHGSSTVGYIGHQSIPGFDDISKLNVLADMSTRKNLIQVVRDPIPHLIARYNQVIFETIQAQLARDEEREAFSLPSLESFSFGAWAEMCVTTYRKSFGRFKNYKLIDFSQLQTQKDFAATMSGVVDMLGLPVPEEGKSFDHRQGDQMRRLLRETSIVVRAGKKNFKVRALADNGPGADPRLDAVARQIPWPAQSAGLRLSVPAANEQEYDALMDAFVQGEWHRLLAKINRITTAYEERKMIHLPPAIEHGVRKELAGEVRKAYRAHPFLKDVWTF